MYQLFNYILYAVMVWSGTISFMVRILIFMPFIPRLWFIPAKYAQSNWTQSCFDENFLKNFTVVEVKIFPYGQDMPHKIVWNYHSTKIIWTDTTGTVDKTYAGINKTICQKKFIIFSLFYYSTLLSLIPLFDETCQFLVRLFVYFRMIFFSILQYRTIQIFFELTWGILQHFRLWDRTNLAVIHGKNAFRKIYFSHTYDPHFFLCSIGK